MNCKNPPQYEIAYRVGATPGMLTHLIKRRNKTTNIRLAIEAAKLTGEAPVDFISKSVKKYAVAINPDLEKKCAVHAKKVTKKAQ